MLVRSRAGVIAVVASLWWLTVGPTGPDPAAAGGPAAAELQKLTDVREAIEHAKGRVFPAVVFIKCRSENYDAGKRMVIESSGSGVLISDQAEVLTNWHVVDKAVDVRCLLFDGTPAPAKVLGADKDTDLALLKLELPKGTPAPPFAKIGDSAKLRPDSKLVISRDWANPKQRLNGALQLSRGLAKLA